MVKWIRTWVWCAGLLCAAGASCAEAATNAAAAALGRLQPRGGVVRVAAPYSLQGPSLIAELPVQAGDVVSPGQLLARTHMHAAAEAALAEAGAEVAVRRARLAVVEAGLKPAEIAALAAETERERADLAEAAQLLARAERLRGESTISVQELENAQARFLSASNRVVAATQRLAAGAEVRPVDVALARAEVAAAEAAVERARRVRSPFAGEVLALHARVGEVAAGGLLDLGRTASMEVEAEVYESDIARIRPQQRAEVRGDAFPGVLPARVTAIGRQVRPNRLLHSDPAAFADNRVIEVTRPSRTAVARL
ncbi:MAG TPA: efflux RND transporter periplasmic adaptor subunit, partial [Verrucomicrobiota bacterium]|nr:efflux RND transporter periplasmic adaptor subunit [Verrucomicrobiota bacterium]